MFNHGMRITRNGTEAKAKQNKTKQKGLGIWLLSGYHQIVVFGQFSWIQIFIHFQ